MSSVQCELLGYCNCKQNVIRCQLGRRWGKWLGKSSKMHRAKTLAALGVSPVEAGLRTASVFLRPSACYLNVWSRPTFCLHALRDRPSARAERLWVTVPLPSARLSTRFMFVTASPLLLLLFALYFNPNPRYLKTTWWSYTILEKLCRRTQYRSGNFTEPSLAPQAGSSLTLRLPD